MKDFCKAMAVAITGLAIEIAASEHPNVAWAYVALIFIAGAIYND